MDYLTIKNRGEISFFEKKSEFIGYSCPVKSVEEATNFISEIKSMHKKATHNVSAFIIRSGNIQRYSDDGEPQGTAGIPVLEVIKKEGLTDICIVVTRYFGGILLGGGGLVRAYSSSAKASIDQAGIVNMCECACLTIKTDYSTYGSITYAIPQFDVKLVDTIFADDVTIKINVKSGFIQPLVKKLNDMSNGQIFIDTSDKFHDDFGV